MSSALLYISPCNSLSKEEQKETKDKQNDIQIYVYIYIISLQYTVNVYVFQIVSILFHTLCNAMFSSSLQYMAMAKSLPATSTVAKDETTHYVHKALKQTLSFTILGFASKKWTPRKGTPVCKHWESIWSAEQIGSCLFIGGRFFAVEGHESPDMHVEMCRPWRLFFFLIGNAYCPHSNISNVDATYTRTQSNQLSHLPPPSTSLAGDTTGNANGVSCWRTPPPLHSPNAS